MKSCYVLTELTNLKNHNRNHYRLDKTIRVFEDFESAKVCMRSAIKELALSKNDLFDGEGNLIGFDEEFENIIEEEKYLCEEVSESFFNFYIKNIPAILTVYFLGEDIPFDDKFYKYFDTPNFRINELGSGWDYYPSSTDLYFESIPFRLFNMPKYPFIQINAFEMNDPEKTYITRIHSGCEEWDQPAFFHIELRKIDIE